MPANVSIRKERFADEYVKDGNGAAAYRRAGFNPQTDESARAGACRLLAAPDVATMVARKRKALSATAMVQASELLAEIDALALSDISDVLDFSGEHPRIRLACEIPARARRAIASVKVKRSLEKKTDGKGVNEVEIIEFKFWPKPDALRLALQRRGLLEPLDGPEGETPCKVYLNFDPADLLSPPTDHTRP